MLLPLVAAALAATPPRPAAALDDAPALVVEVEEPARLPAPCERVLDARTAPGLPIRRADDAWVQAPGLLFSDLLGTGAARASSWRGFSASYGADVEVTVDGVPAGHPGHPGAEGWTSLAWIPRLLIGKVDACGGVTDGAVGPRAMAGSVALDLGLAREGWYAGLQAGTDSSGALTVAFRPRGWSDRTYVVVEAEDGAGVGSDRRWRDLRVVAGLERDLREVHVAATLAFRDGGWDVPPRLRTDDVEAGDLGFRESYRAWKGEASAQSARLTLAVSRPWTWGGLVVRGWFDAQRLVLADNPTGFLGDDRRGDGAQREGASYDSGLRARFRAHRAMLGDRSSLEAGLEVRGTAARTSSAPVDLELVPLGTGEAVQRGTLDLGVWGQGTLALYERVRLQAGFRADRLELSRADDTPGGRRDAGGAFALQPRVVLEGEPGRVARLWASWSRGARPPLADDLLRPEPVAAPRLDTVEGGLHLTFWPRVEASFSFFGALGHDEVVLDPLLGDVLGRGATRRLGGAAVLTVWPITGVRIRVDGALADGRWADGGPLPYASRGRVAVGLYADGRRVGPVVLDGGLRFAWTPPRPTRGDVTSGGIATLDARVRVAWKRWWFDVQIDNLAPWDWWTVESAWASRWDPESTASLETVRHGVPGGPFALVLGVGHGF